ALKRTPQHLATLAERSAGYCDRLLPSWGRVDAVDADDRRLDLRGGDEHLGWHGETFYHPATEGDHDRGDAVVGGARAGGEPVRDLLLDHDRHGGDLRDAHQHVEDERGSHVVGQVGDELPPVALQLGLQVCVHHVGETQVDVGAGEGLFQHWTQSLVDFVGDDPGAGGGECPCQRPGAGSDLQHPVPWAHLGDLDHLADQVG